MAELDLEAIRERVEAATPGPWESVIGQVAMHSVYAVGYHRANVANLIAAENNAADAEFIAASREDVPALLDRIAALERELSDYRQREAITDALIRANGDSIAALEREITIMDAAHEVRIADLTHEQEIAARDRMQLTSIVVHLREQHAAAMAIVRAVAALEGKYDVGREREYPFWRISPLIEEARALLAGQAGKE